MGEVILFDKAKKRKKEFNSKNKKNSKMIEEKTTIENSMIDVAYVGIKPDEQIEHWKNIEKEEDERFRCKYSDVLATVPIAAGTKMQYFAAAMLKLIPNIFHDSSWDARFDAFMDFCEFYISEFDPAYSDYLKANKEFEKTYLYEFKPISEKTLEDNLKDCLRTIVEICPERKEEDKAKMLYQAARLFELEEILSDIFYKELMKE